MLLFVLDSFVSSSMLQYSIRTNKHLLDSVAIKSSVTRVNDDVAVRADISEASSSMSLSDESTEEPMPSMAPKEVDALLDDYQLEFGAGFSRPVVTSSQGEIDSSPQPSNYPSRLELQKGSNLRVRSTASFRVKFLDLRLEHVMLHLLHPDQINFLPRMICYHWLGLILISRLWYLSRSAFVH